MRSVAPLPRAGGNGGRGTRGEVGWSINHQGLLERRLASFLVLGKILIIMAAASFALLLCRFRCRVWYNNNDDQLLRSKVKRNNMDIIVVDAIPLLIIDVSIYKCWASSVDLFEVVYSLQQPHDMHYLIYWFDANKRATYTMIPSPKAHL